MFSFTHYVSPPCCCCALSVFPEHIVERGFMIVVSEAVVVGLATDFS